MLVGPDDLFLAVLACGADGVISGTSNAIPEHYVAMYKAWVSGNVELAQKIMAKILRLHRVVSGPNHMARYKAVLKRRGVIGCAAMRRPFRGLTPEEEKKFFETIDALAYLSPDELL